MLNGEKMLADNQISLPRPGFREEYENVKELLKRRYGLNQILGQSKAIKELHKKIDRISLSNINVLITGECGTGKELAARAIHYLSNMKAKPFIPVN
jgi:transcriptional regulator with GAF, ATPase, and Fis domain